MREARLIAFGAWAGALGGALRIASSFIPYAPQIAWLEALYAVIDLGMLFGLIAAYLAASDAIGAFGFAGFVIGAAGLASIVGPDAQMFGVDFYRVGAFVFLVGLALFAAALLGAQRLRISAWLWVASFLVGVAAATTGQALAFAVAGVLLGAGFVASGAEILRGRQHHPSPLVREGGA